MNYRPPPVGKDRSREELIRRLQDAWRRVNRDGARVLVMQCWEKWQLGCERPAPSLPLPEQLRTEDKLYIGACLLYATGAGTFTSRRGEELWIEAVSALCRGGKRDVVMHEGILLFNRLLYGDDYRRDEYRVNFVLESLEKYVTTILRSDLNGLRDEFGSKYHPRINNNIVQFRHR